MNNQNLETPVLLIVYRRAETTQKVLHAMRKAQVKNIFVAANAPNPMDQNDSIKCFQVKELIQNIDWDCDVKILNQTTHLSCSASISSAVNWFFEYVEEGIILEDDCVPVQSFFSFCEELLRYYRSDARVMMISGNNHLGTWQNRGASYHFTKVGGCWGWATWKRAWKFFNINMPEWKEEKEKHILSTVFQDPKEADYWKKIFDANPAWDYIWTFYKLINKGLSVVPAVNLIENIGFGKEATHTKDRNQFSPKMIKSFEVQDVNLIHPEHVQSDQEYDANVFNKVTMYKPVKPILKRIGDSIKYRLGM